MKEDGRKEPKKGMQVLTWFTGMSKVLTWFTGMSTVLTWFTGMSVYRDE